MKKLGLWITCLVCVPFLLGLTDQSDPFTDLGQSNGVLENLKEDRQSNHPESNNRYVVIDKEFWARDFSRYLELSSFDKEFKQAEFPSQADFYLRFDDKVVNSFSDHMVTNKVALIHDMFYNLHADKFRVTTLLNYAELNKLDAFKGLLELEGAPERLNKGDVAILAIDITLKIFNLENQTNTIFLAFDNLKTYRFWRDGRNSKATGDRANEQVFRRYVENSVKGSGVQDIKGKIEELEKRQQEMEAAQNYKEALELSKQIKEVSQNGEFLRLVEDRFNTQITLKPKFVGTLLEFMKQSEVFNQFLDLTHYHVVSGQGENQKVTQLIKVSQLEKALKLALPEVEINYVNILDGRMSLTGRVIKNSNND